MIEIKRGLATIATVRADQASEKLKIMADNMVSLSFTLFNNIVFEIGDYINVFGNDYFLNVLPSVNKKSSIEFEYNCQFEGSTLELNKVQLMMLDDANALQDSEFSIMGNASVIIDLILRNLNRVQAGWTAGDIDSTEYKNLSFSNENCLGALSTLATEFKTEFWVIGKTIHFTKKGANSGLSFEYGKGKGLYNIARSNFDNSNVVTRLYAFGATKNIPNDYRNYANRLRIPLTANAGKIFIEQNVASYGVIEATQFFDDIYPHREGTVSAVDGFLKFTDTSLDFDVNAQLLPGIVAKLTFNTGQLAGYEFDVSSYNNATKQFKINVNDNEKALQVPSADFAPNIGDKYVLTDIKMPQSYIDAAEAELFTKATEFLTANSVSRVSYTVECDRLHFQRENITPVLGSYVNIKDVDFGLDKDFRIIGLTRDLNNIYQYTLELSESVQPSAIVRNYIANQKIATAIKINNLLDPAKARRNWRNSQELLNMVFDNDGYFTEKIKPLIVETAALAVGTKSQQFDLMGLVVEANFEGDINKFRSSVCVLDHFSIDPTQVVSWNISASSYNSLVTGTAYYIYAKCSKTGNTGTLLLTTAQITVDQDANFYHFLIGVLHSTTSGQARGMSLTFGQTTVNGKFIKTGRIQSQDGNTYFDLDAGTIGGVIKFSNGQEIKTVTDNLGTGLTATDNKAQLAIDNAANALATANNVALKTDFLTTTIDGNVVATGTMLVGDALGNNNAGVSGVVDDAGSSVRFWAGSDYANRNTAPFRVQQDGFLASTSGIIGGWNIGTDKIFSGVLSGNYIELQSGTNPRIFMKNAQQVVADDQYSQLTPNSFFIASNGESLPLGEWAGLPASIDNVVAGISLNNFTPISGKTRFALYVKAPIGNTSAIALRVDGSVQFFGATTFSVVSGSILLISDEIFLGSKTLYLHVSTPTTSGGGTMKALYYNTANGRVYRNS